MVKRVKGKMETGYAYYMDIGGCNRLCPAANGAYLGYTVSLFVLIKDRPLLWMVVRSHTYYPKHILAYGSRKTCYALVVGSGFFRTD